jgi:Holliday junction resolvase RusA-like endonuclease
VPKVSIKPLTVNKAWQGKRFKTPKYKAYEKELLLKLRPLSVPEGKLMLIVVFGVSSKLSDWDNPVKPFQDCLQKKYGFDDRRIYEASVKKMDVKKGEEFIEFEIKQLEE